MHSHETLLQKFYQAFRDKNVEEMVSCYHPTARFTDPVFGTLEGEALKGMWAMVLEKSPDLTIKIGNIQADDEKGKVSWTSTYIFSKTNRLIQNNVYSRFKFKDGLILVQNDQFSIWKWAGMALGFSGYLLGFTSVIRNHVQLDARNNLKIFLKRRRA